MTKQVFVNHLKESARRAGVLAELGRPFDESRDKLGLLQDDLKYAAGYAEFCLGWPALSRIADRQ